MKPITEAPLGIQFLISELSEKHRQEGGKKFDYSRCFKLDADGAWIEYADGSRFFVNAFDLDAANRVAMRAL